MFYAGIIVMFYAGIIVAISRRVQAEHGLATPANRDGPPLEGTTCRRASEGMPALHYAG
jgi:hypothetical protein